MTSLRARLSDGLFAMVAGPDGPAARERIHTTPGPRWFPPGSPIQRVHGDTSMYIGGLRALLLQSLHPLAMAAVDDFSDFRHDVWGRLARTSTFLAETTFAAAPDAERAVAVVRAVHRHIAGTAPDGRPYRADDPHLLTSALVVAAAVLGVALSEPAVGWLPLGLGAAFGVVASRTRVWVVWRVGDGFGYGDVRLAGLVGGVAGALGVQMWWQSLLASAVIGAVAGLGVHLWRRRHASPLGSAFPYGPALWAGPFVALLVA